MMRRFAAILLVAALLALAVGCSSDGDQPQATQESAAAVAQSQQSDQQEQAPAAYQAGESESEEEQAAQPVQAEREQAQEQAAEQPAQQPEAAQPEQVETAAQEETPSQQDQPVESEEAGDQAMVGMIIESGHRAGVFANRNVLGSPDAPIVIAEYSDFL